MIIKSKQAEEHFDRGINYFRAEFYSSALQEFNQVKNIEPDYPNIDFIIEAAIKRNREIAGQLTSFIQDNFDDEIQELSDELTVENSTMLGSEVKALLKRGNYSEAMRKLKQAESVVPDSRPLLLLLGNTQRRLGLLTEAEKTLQHAANTFPEDSEILNNLGNVLLDMSLYKDAEDVFRMALRLSPENPRLLNNLGAMRMQTNNLDDAEKLFRKVIKLQPKWSTVQKNLHNLRSRIEALDSDIENFRTEYLKHPDYLDIGLALGKSLFFRGYFSEARTTFKSVLKRNPGLVAAHFYMATICELSDDTEKAIEHYRQMALKTGKEDTPEFVNFESLVKQEFFEEALNELKKIAILELDIAASRINLGIRYFEDCAWDDALRHFEEASQINDTYPDAFYWAALAHVQLNDTARAKELLEKALELNPDYADAHFQLGMLLRSKAKKKARTHFIKALSLNVRPSFARIAQQLIDEQK